MVEPLNFSYIKTRNLLDNRDILNGVKKLYINKNDITFLFVPFNYFKDGKEEFKPKNGNLEFWTTENFSHINKTDLRRRKEADNLIGNYKIKTEIEFSIKINGENDFF